MNVALFILIAVFWGGSFLAINLSLKGFSPFLAATFRVAIAVILTFLYVTWKKTPYPKRKYVIQTILSGAVGIGIPWALLFWGEQFVSPALSSIINATAPIFTIIFAAIILRSSQDRMTWNKWLGVLLGFSGIAVIFGPFITEKSLQNIEGLAAIVGMAICYGLGIVWLKILTKHVSNLMALLLQCTGALIFLFPIALYYGLTHYWVTGENLLEASLAVLYLGIFSTTFAFIIFYKLLREIGTVQTAAVTYLIPIVSIFLDWLVLDTWIGTHSLFGALLVFASLKLINKPVSPSYNT